MILSRHIFKLLLLINTFKPLYGVLNGAIVSGRVPYLVALKEDLQIGYTVCTGAIIGVDLILTHAPCLFELRGKIWIYYGANDINKSKLKTSVKKVTIHELFVPKYSSIRTIALVKTSDKLIIKGLSDTIQIANHSINEAAYEKCKLQAYGTRFEDYIKNNKTVKRIKHGILYGGHVEEIKYPGKDGQCGCTDNLLKSYQKMEYLCNMKGTGRVCVGDFGAPLVCEVKKKLVVVGVANNFIACKGYDPLKRYIDDRLHTPCGSSLATDIYTYLHPYKSWLQKEISLLTTPPPKPPKPKKPKPTKKPAKSNVLATLLQRSSALCVFLMFIILYKYF